MKFEEINYSVSDSNKYQRIEQIVEQIHQKVQGEVVKSCKNYQTEEIAEISLKVCTAMLLEFMKYRVDHGENF